MSDNPTDVPHGTKNALVVGALPKEGRFLIPMDKSILAEVKEAMRAFPGNAALAAKSINMGESSFRFIRRLVTLEARPSLPCANREVVQKCLSLIESERQLGSARKIINGIAIQPDLKKDRSYIVNTRRRRFDQNLTAINESCESTIEMELPKDINQDETLKAIRTLSRSVELIGKLLQKLVGGNTDE